MSEHKDPREKKCAICGKDMYAREEWVFKRRPKGDKTIWFCSHKCMRAWDAKHDKTKPVRIPKETEPMDKKDPQDRAEVAQVLAGVIRNGGSVIGKLKEMGYKNPYEAYSAVRHYCETKMPEMADVLKPLKELPKGPPAQTGRPKKEPAEVEKVDKVPPVEEKLEPVQCIAHVTDAELAEAEEPKSEDAHLETETIQVDENTMRQVFHFYTREDLLRIVDAAALKCQADKCYRWGSDTLEQQMFHDARTNAVGIGVMKLRGEIRKMLGADEDEDA